MNIAFRFFRVAGVLLVIAFGAILLTSCQSDGEKGMGDQALTQFAVANKAQASFSSHIASDGASVVWDPSFTVQDMNQYLAQNAAAWEAVGMWFGSIQVAKPSK